MTISVAFGSQSLCDPGSLTSCSLCPGADPFRLNWGDRYNPENTAEVTVVTSMAKSGKALQLLAHP